MNRLYGYITSLRASSKLYAFKSPSIDIIQQSSCQKMPPNYKEFDSPTESDSLLEAESDYQDSEPRHNQKKSKESGPDGVRSWVVAFANFLINFIVVGLGRMSGILYVAFMHMFHIDRQTASMPFSIQQAARNLFGPLAGILGQKYGVRNVTILGGVIGTFSAMACFFVMNITWITVLWGLVFGICTALTTTLNQVPIDQYFERYRTTAGGVAFSGGCVAAFIFPVILENLIDHYGMGRTFLAMGAVIFFVIPAAMILVEPPWMSKKEMPQVLEKDFTKSSLSNRKPKTYNTFCLPTKKQISRRSRKSVDFEFLRQNSEFVYQLFILTIPDEIILSESFSDALWSCADTRLLVNELKELHDFLQVTTSDEAAAKDFFTQSVHVVEVTINGYPKQNSTDVVNIRHTELGNENSPTPSNYRKYEDNPRWLFLATKVREICERRESALLLYFPSITHLVVLKILDMLKGLNELLNESDNSADSAVENVTVSMSANLTPYNPDFLPETSRNELKRQNEEKPNSFMAHIKTAIKLHTNPIFLLICLCRGVFMLTFIPLVTIIVDFAMDKGLQQSTGKYVIAILSMGDLLGRLCLGWINDIGCISLPRYMLVVMLLLAISTGTLPLMHSEVSLMPAILIFGMLQGSLFVRHQILVSKYMDSHEQAIGMGFINLLSGFIGLALPFYIGYFRDTQGSYDNMFYLNGAICALIGSMWIFEPLLLRFSSKGMKCEDAIEAS